MVTCQSANQLKTPAKVSWAFKMVSQFGSLGYKSWGSLLIWQLSRRQSLTPFTRRVSHKHSLPKKLAVHRVLYPSMLTESWVEKKCGRKRCTTNRENRSLMRIVKQNRFKNLGELHKEWTEAGVKASRATTHRRVKEFGYSCRIPLVKPLLNHRQRQRHLTWAKEKKNWTVAQWSKVLFSDESKFCISFGNQGPRVWRKGGEAHSPSCMKSSVKFPQSVIIWGAMSSAGVGPLCFLKTNATAPDYQDILVHFMLPSADQLFKDADFIFQQDLAPAHTAKSTKSWLNDHGVGVLDWPANSPDLNPIENLWGIVKRKMRNKRLKMQMTWRPLSKKPGLHTTSAVPQTDPSMPRRIEAVIKQKEPLPSIEYIYSKLNIFPEGQQFTKNVFFYWSYEVFYWVLLNVRLNQSQLKEPKTSKLLQSVCIEFI